VPGSALTAGMCTGAWAGAIW